MKRILATLLFCAVALPAAAQDLDMLRLLKADGRVGIEADLGGGLYSITLPANSDLAVRESAGKSAFSYIVYTSIGKPDITGGIDAFDVMPLEFAEYWYALVVANFGATSITGTATFTLKGPVKWKKTFPGITLSSSSITVLFFQAEALDAVGNYLLLAKFGKAGRMKSRFCAGC